MAESSCAHEVSLGDRQFGFKVFLWIRSALVAGNKHNLIRTKSDIRSTICRAREDYFWRLLG